MSLLRDGLWKDVDSPICRVVIGDRRLGFWPMVSQVLVNNAVTGVQLKTP